ncbi:hypothetical protein HMPREF1624_03514 [Sporothrix schenckii ATCC 58251]|uniref:Uncharacterized protein n=1 Tax=Sporothrix schenckii (strain ATCC 58251 / de Perez 2211183) TaxID=1391915 RepID=U7PZH9_SPOS1|nr:hypothetical protein HMPREF1624_03514 [Sporothrix schenckii ATCC 58251]
MAPDQSASDVRGSTGSNGPTTGKLAATPAYFQDMRTFASSPTPIVARRDDDGNIVDRDSRASGIRAMVMSVSYLKKYEVLRRISPPRPVPPRRGLFIAIEGHNAALRDAVGRIVERALVSCGECNIRSWTMTPLEGDETSGIHGMQKRNTDSGVGSSIHVEDVSMAPSPESGGDCNSRRGSTSFESTHPTSLSFTISTIEDLMRLVPTWHKITTEINDHIHTAGGSSEILGSVPLSRKVKDISNGPPSPARSPMDLRLSPTSQSSALQSEGSSKAPDSSRMVQTCDDSQASASPSLHSTTTTLANSQPSQLLPVALVTTGYSLAIADKCAISIPINDSFPPIAHWEYMAGLWRGTPGPDLVVYADPSPPPLTSNGARGPTVHFMDQEGILVAHIPPPKTAVDKQVGSADHSNDTNSNDKDGDDDGSSIMDQKTERRLTFEILELVRSGNFGAFKEET